MEAREKFHIRRNVEQLTRFTSCSNPFLIDLRSKGVLYDQDIKYLNSIPLQQARSLQLFKILEGRPGSYLALSDTFQETGQFAAAMILQQLGPAPARKEQYRHFVVTNNNLNNNNIARINSINIYDLQNKNYQNYQSYQNNNVRSTPPPPPPMAALESRKVERVVSQVDTSVVKKADKKTSKKDKKSKKSGKKSKKGGKKEKSNLEKGVEALENAEEILGNIEDGIELAGDIADLVGGELPEGLEDIGDAAGKATDIINMILPCFKKNDSSSDDDSD